MNSQTTQPNQTDAPKVHKLDEHQDPWLSLDLESFGDTLEDFQLVNTIENIDNLVHDRLLIMSEDIIKEDPDLKTIPVTLPDLVASQTGTLRLNGGAPTIPPDDEVLPIDSEGLVQFKEDDCDADQFCFPRKVANIEMPGPGQRPSLIQSNNREIEILVNDTIILCQSIGSVHNTWITACRQQIREYLVEARVSYKSPEKRTIVEQHLKILWLKEWKRRLLLRMTTFSEDSDSSTKVSPINVTRHLDMDSHSLKHAFRGSQTFKQLLIVLFSTSPEQILNAKLDLLATSEEACVKYSRSQILMSFLQICRACSITADELINYSVRVLDQVSVRGSVRHCLCGHPVPDMALWNLHQCTFERWLIDMGIVEVRNGRMFSRTTVNWNQIYERLSRQPLVQRFAYLDLQSNPTTPTNLTRRSSKSSVASSVAY